MSTPDTLSDASTRRRIGPWREDGLAPLDRFEPDTNFLVRAAAGSGKTTALVARMVALVRAGVPIRECSAITFTRKAASEMKARLYNELREAERHLLRAGDDTSDQYQRVQRARKNLPRCFIGTIHSFCARLLRERPLTAGLSPDFVAGIDERDRDTLRNRVWQSYLSDVWQNDEDRINRIASLGIEPSELVHFFGELCRYPDLTPYVDGPKTPPNLGDTVHRLDQFVDRWIEYLPDDPGDGDASPGDAAEAIRRADRFRRFRSFTDPAAQAEFIALFDGLTRTDTRKSTDADVRGCVTLGHWLDRDAAKRLDNERLPRLAENVVEPALERWRAFVHRELVGFTRPAVDRYTERRRETGQLTFQDLLVHARTLLRDHPDARRALQQEYPRLLVDEFQDTDPIQAELLFFLASDDPTEREWRQCSPRDGSLFIVGDDKQSIYRFRRADLDVYETVREAIDRAPNGEDVTLSTNFRSVSPLLDWCNEAFGDIFETMDAPYQAPYVDFQPARSEVPDAPVVRNLQVPYVKGASWPANIAERNAKQIADYITAACNRSEALLHDEEETARVDGTPGEFMILTRVTSRLQVYAEALAENGIPYTLTGGKDVDASTELRALVTLLTCIERPQDAVARLAYLRGPLVGLSDDALYRYKIAGGSFAGEFELPTEVLRQLDAELTSQLKAAYRHLREARGELRTRRPAAAIERIVDHLGLMTRARRDPGLGSLHAGRLLRVLTDVQKLDADGYTWTAIRDELEQILDGERELDGMTLETGSTDAVRILNVHKAKGLEAPVVFLADPYGRNRSHGPTEHVRRDDGEVVLPVYEEHQWNRTLRYAPRRWAEEFEETEAQYQAAEEQRLLYVAATRARDMLVVSRYRSDGWDEDKGYWSPLYPHLDDCPALEVPDAEFADTAGIDDTNVDREAVKHRRATVAKPTFGRKSVTDDTGDGGRHARDGFGENFGQAIHELFAHAIRSRDTVSDAGLSDDLVSAALADWNVEHHTEVADRMLQLFFEGPVWAAVSSAECVHVEYPVSQLQTEGDQVSELTSGTIDLVFKSSGGWHLVDYKTDRVRNDAERLVNAYRPQLATYAEMWEAATGTACVEKGLWLADVGRLVPV